MTSLKRKGEHKDDGGHAKEAKKDYGMSAELLADTRALIQRSLDEDVGSGDVTTLALISEDSKATAKFLAKADGVLSGLRVADLVFDMVDRSLVTVWEKHDGDKVTKGTYFGSVTGSTRSLLVAERLALNLMQRMSGIASATRAMVDAVGKHHTRILDTRKTAPGLRLLDKLAVKHGGGVNHRIGLYDMAMIKDNHVSAAGGITKAVQGMQAWLREQKRADSVQIELETRTLDEVKEALALPAGSVHRLMLDNMVAVREGGRVDTSMLEQALKLIGKRVPTEASGNVTLATVPAIAATGVDFISSGSLTHSVIALDISLKIKAML